MAKTSYEERRARALAMHQQYQSGLSIKEVGKRHGITKQAVSLAFQRYQLPVRPKTKDLNVDLEAVYQRYLDGETLRVLAAEQNVSISTFRHFILKAGYKLQGSGRAYKWPKERVAKLYADYQAGMTQAEVGAAHHISQTFVSTLFLKWGFATRNNTKWTREKVAALFARYQAGLKQAEIAKEAKIPQNNISRLFRKYGFPTHLHHKQSGPKAMHSLN